MERRKFVLHTLKAIPIIFISPSISASCSNDDEPVKMTTTNSYHT